MHRVQFPARPSTEAVRLACTYMALFIVAGVHMPYLPVWLEAKGFDELEIAMAVAVPMLARSFFTPGFSFAAERTVGARAALLPLSVAASLTILLLWRVSGFPATLAVLTLFMLFWATLMPMLEALALSVAQRGGSYGRVRLWGSISFIATGLAAGPLIDMHGIDTVPWLLLFGSILTVLACSLMRSAPDALPLSTPQFSDLRRLAGDRRLWLIIAGCGLLQSSHAVYYAFGSVHWAAQGVSSTQIGALWGIGVAAEVMLFAISPTLLARYGPERLLLAGCICGVVRWPLMAFSLPLPALMAVQLLHAGTFAAGHVAALTLIARHFPAPVSGTAQGFYAAGVSGLATGAGILAAGPLYAAFGGHAYGFMALQAACAAIVARLALQRLR